jgi:hypothetical protein
MKKYVTIEDCIEVMEDILKEASRYLLDSGCIDNMQDRLADLAVDLPTTTAGIPPDTSPYVFSHELNALISDNSEEPASVYYTWNDVLRSETATRLGIENIPIAEAEEKTLVHIIEHIIQPFQAWFDSSNDLYVYITSGYRSPELNKHIPGADENSQHMRGQAIDFVLVGLTHDETASSFDQFLLEENIEFDQFIKEESWIHISCNPAGTNRMQRLASYKENGETKYTEIRYA